MGAVLWAIIAVLLLVAFLGFIGIIALLEPILWVLLLVAAALFVINMFARRTRV